MRKEIEAIYRKHDGDKYSYHDPIINDLTALFESKLEEAVKNMEYVEMEAPETSEPPTFHGPAFGLSDHEKLRREHWSRAYCCVVANVDNSHDFCKATADIALETFDNKFK